MNYDLWDYQDDVYQKVNRLLYAGERKICVQMPTRSGKSAVISKLTEDFYLQKKVVWFIAHTNILISQMSQELTFHGIKHGLIQPRKPMLRYRVQVASKDSLVSRIMWLIGSGWKLPDLVIIDETHMALAKTFIEIIQILNQSIFIGFTATPVRRDGKPLGDIYDVMAIGPSIPTLQKRGKLAYVDTYGVNLISTDDITIRNGDYVEKEALEKVDKRMIISGVVDHWERHAKGLKTLTFAVNIEHAKHLAQQFTERGYPSIDISSDDGQEVIDEKLKGYYSGKYLNMVSVNLFLMGFTIKECRCIVQCRPTTSIMVYMQSIGRGMIPNDDGSHLINLDCVNNWKNLNLLPDDEIEWSLKGKIAKIQQQSNRKHCPVCAEPNLSTAKKCEACGFLWSVVSQGRDLVPEEVSGTMVRISRKQENELSWRVAREARTFDQAVSIVGDVKMAEKIWCQKLKNKIHA